MAKLVDSRSTEGARGHFKALGRNAGPFCCVGLSDPEKMDLTQPKEEARNGVGGAPRPRSIAIHLPRQGHSAPQPGAFRGYFDSWCSKIGLCGCLRSAAGFAPNLLLLFQSHFPSDSPRWSHS
jgi:hypothetical protein